MDTFLAWEGRQELRWEFDGFAPVAMTGGSNEHEAIGTRLRTLLDVALMDKRCRVRGPTMKIEVAGRIRYPDAFVFCSATTRGQTVIADPVVVFEVLSLSTSHIDRLDKLREYQATPSIRRYVILEQDSVAATIYLKQGEAWIVSVLISEAMLTMPEVEAEIPLADIYAGIELPRPETAEG
jgi:Uma2 family endonuclease